MVCLTSLDLQQKFSQWNAAGAISRCSKGPKSFGESSAICQSLIKAHSVGCQSTRSSGRLLIHFKRPKAGPSSQPTAGMGTWVICRVKVSCPTASVSG